MADNRRRRFEEDAQFLERDEDHSEYDDGPLTPAERRRVRKMLRTYDGFLFMGEIGNKIVRILLGLGVVLGSFEALRGPLGDWLRGL